MITDLFSNAFLVGQMNMGLLFMEVLLFISSVFLMLLVLVQRGKGGGLTGALGGMGGQSAFGSKAGDAFTKITVITAMVWITLCMVTIAAFNPPPKSAKKDKPVVTDVDSMSTNSESEDADEDLSNSMLPGEGESESGEGNVDADGENTPDNGGVDVNPIDVR